MPIRRILAVILFAIACLICAEIILRAFAIPSYILPKPVEVIFAMQDQSSTMIIAWKTTLLETIVGLCLALMMATLLAFLTVFLPKQVAITINQVGIIVQCIPLLAIAPLLSIWFGHGFTTKAVAACIVSIFPLLTGWMTGFKSVNIEYIQYFDSIRATSFQRFRYLLIPNALPYFFGGLRVATPLALLGAIIGEFIGSSQGIGFQILSNSYYMRTPLMFGYITIAAATGLLLTTIIVVIERKLLFWHAK